MNFLRVSEVVNTKEKRVVIQPEKTTNLINTKEKPLDKEIKGISNSMHSGLERITKLVSIKKQESVKLDKKLAHTFCFFDKREPDLAITTPLIEKFKAE